MTHTEKSGGGGTLHAFIKVFFISSSGLSSRFTTHTRNTFFVTKKGKIPKAKKKATYNWLCLVCY